MPLPRGVPKRRVYCTSKCRVQWNEKKNSRRTPNKHNWQLKTSLLNDGDVFKRKFTTPWDEWKHSATLREVARSC